MPRTSRLRPNELVSPWPHGETSDPAAAVAAIFVSELRNTIEGQSVRAVAAHCGVNHQTLRSILAGEVWPDMRTIALLEFGLKKAFWPRFQ
jgi:lambda repressor-like predicted transcriptional regulator